MSQWKDRVKDRELQVDRAKRDVHNRFVYLHPEERVKAYEQMTESSAQAAKAQAETNERDGTPDKRD